MSDPIYDKEKPVEKPITTSSDTDNGSKPLSSDQLKNSESGAGQDKNTDTLGKGYTGKDSGRSGSRLKSITKSVSAVAGNKKALAGGGVGAGIITVIFISFFAAASMKIESIVEDLQNHFFSTSENAVQDENRNLLAGYIEKVLPSYKSCGLTTDRYCTTNIVGSNPIDDLYRSWSHAKLETTLANKYGIEFYYDNGSHTYYLKAPGANQTPKGDPIGGQIPADSDEGPGLDSLENEFNRSDRTEVRSTIDTALKDETAWKQVFYRYKVGRLLEEKYNIKRCIIACGSVRDPLANYANEKKNAMEIYLVQRVIQPRDLELGIVLKCLIDPNCKAGQPGDDTPTDTASAPCTISCDELDGAPESAVDGEITSTLAQNAAAFGLTDSTSIANMISKYNDIAEAGYTNYAVNSLITNIFGEEVADQTSSALPVVGWVHTATEIINSVTSSGPKVKVLSYAINSAAAVSLYEMYRTYADEIKSGNADSAEYGSFVNALGPGNHADTTDTSGNAINDNSNEIGGTSGAEGTPLYSYLIEGNSPTSATAATTSTPNPISDVANPLAFAASSSSSSTSSSTPQYLCSNSQPVPAGKLVCPEETLGAGNGLLNSIDNEITSNPALKTLSQISKTLSGPLNTAFDAVSNALGWLIDNVPLVSQLTKEIGGIIGNLVQPVEKWVVSELIPDPFGTNMSGGRTFDMMAAGADVAGNDESHNGLGGVALTPTQTAEITNQQESEDQQEFDQQPLMARIFSSTSPYSLISRISARLPFGTSADINSISSIFVNPFSGIMHSFSTIFNGKASAAAAIPDPFGVTQYGYPTGTIPTDPETYWNQYCNDSPNDVAQGSATVQYNQNAVKTVDQNGEPENVANSSLPSDGTDPCLLIQAAVGSSGAIYDESLLTPDDLADINGGGSSTTGSTASNNNNIYWVGDSITVGMEGAGLQTDLQSKGYNVNKIEAKVGDSVADALPKVQADSSELNNAGTVVVELGTNDCSLSGTPTCESTPEFETQIQNMIQAIRSIDSGAQIYWVNIYTTKGPEYTSINQAITAEATTLNYKVIDWASEATTNPSKYSFDSIYGVHQTTQTGWQNMANFVTSQLSSAPGSNVVSESIFGNQPQKPSMLSNMGSVFSKLVSSVVSISKKTSLVQ